MDQLHRQQLVDLERVIAVALQVSVNDFLDFLALDERPRQRAGVEQHVADISGQGSPVPMAEVIELVSAEEEALEVTGGKPMIEASQPLRHPVVVGVLGFERELENVSGHRADQTS